MPHRRQPARDARRFEAAPVKIGEVVPQCLGFGAGKAVAGRSEKFRKIREVAPVGVERVNAGALFRREHVEEQIDQFGIRGPGTHWSPTSPQIPMRLLVSGAVGVTVYRSTKSY